MLLTILGGVAAVLAILIVVVALQPAAFSFSRSASYSAPAERVFEMVNDLHKFNEWSPWDEKDPDMKRTYEGPRSGVGAHYGWDGNKDVGLGSMTITASKSNERVEMNLDFLKPFEAHNRVIFALSSDGAKTKLTWTMEGENNFIGKFFALIFSMDKMVGPDFEQGLENIRALVEQ